MNRFLLAALLLPVLLPARAQVDAPAARVVLNLAAHPDDEDGQTLAYYRMQDAAAFSVIYTRGEGGQNEIGPDLYERLGAIRTEETERAARHLGTQVLFLNYPDFGYSKFADEAFEAWGGREAVTARVVRLIRRLKPDVLFTNHDTVTVGPRQHGHHQAVGLSAYDAFALAADPAYRPEQLAEDGVDLWQPQRLFLRKWRKPDSFDVAVPVGRPDAGGVSAADRAVRALNEHRSQGMQFFADRIRADSTYFVLLREAPGAPPLPAGAMELDAGLPPHPAPPAFSLSYLIDSGRIPPMPGGLVASDSVATPGASVVLRWPAVPADRRWLVTLSGAVDTAFAADAGTAVLPLPHNARPTLPKRLRQYDRFESSPPIAYAVTEPRTGRTLYAGYVPLEIAPPVVLDMPDATARLAPGRNALPFRLDAYGAAGPFELEATVLPEGQDTPVVVETATSDGGADSVVVHLPPLAAGRYRVVLAAAGFAAERPAAVLPEVRVPDGLRVGFVRSYDGVTEDALRAMGAEVVALDSAALATRDLGDLHTIWLDIRAALVRPDLRAALPRLLDWTRAGGHLVVAYHKTMEWNEAPLAPFPLRLGRGRVTYEDAPVTVLRPEDPLLTFPYRIAEADWAGWVQERGLYFPEDYAPEYRALLAMHDPGEAPLEGALLTARVGEGFYTYTALGLYRQLSALVPGAWRLAANLASRPMAPAE